VVKKISEENGLRKLKTCPENFINLIDTDALRLFIKSQEHD
jgi:hypothetical protein